MERLSATFLFFFLGTIVNGEIRIDLGTNKLDGSWTVWNQNKSIKIPVRVPGGIYTDLQTAGVLGNNLFYRFNDIEYRWVAKEDWTYRNTFDLDPGMINHTAINLVFHGIDTIGDIYLNGNFLKSVNNMFVRYVLPIKGIVKEKNNTLEVRLKSPIHEAKRLSDIQKKLYPVPPECVPNHYNGECHVNFLRKMQASFSWDWGPAFPSVGIWKPVEVEAFSLGVIRDIVITPVKVNSTMWSIDMFTHVEYAEEIPTPHQIAVEIMTSKGIKFETKMDDSVKDVTVKNGYVSHVRVYLDKGLGDVWYPTGFGNQDLVNITVSLSDVNDTEKSVKVIQTGIREVKLVQEVLQKGKEGLSFYFTVNDIPIFAKGSNWIPGHVLPELGNNETMVRHLLQSVKDANMNILRVWGGGVYESDLFYKVADELGILIWQDMMFACSMYPIDGKFLKSVQVETQQQIRRLQHHPSIVLWAGNNENEAALRGNWYHTSGNYSLYKRDYIKLYVDTVKTTVLENDKSRPYVVSSPSNGVRSEKEDYVSKDPYSPLFGDVHHYNYFFDGWNDFNYPDTRFASEYGFQSLPSFKALSEVTFPSDRTMESEFICKRQHLLAGNLLMKGQIIRQLPLPHDDGSEEYFKTFIYYSQISQAMSTKVETEKYRRGRGKLTEDNKGNTMGAMYWQLNDVWQAPSWSSIEFGGKWKMLQYFAKRFFTPVLVSPEETLFGKLKVFLISDLLKDVPDVRLNISIYSWDNFTPKKTISTKVLLNKATTKEHASYCINELLEQVDCNKHICFFYFTIEGPNIYSDNFLLPSRLHDIKNLQKPNLQVDVTKGSKPHQVAVKVTTDRIAPFVWLETDELGEFSDNGFLLLKNEINLTFTSRYNTPITAEKIKQTLTVRSVLN